MVRLELQGGGDAVLTRVDGERAGLDASRAAAPGSRLEGSYEGRTFKVKVHRCVREGDRFVIDGRFIDLTRADRLLLIERSTA